MPTTVAAGTGTAAVKLVPDPLNGATGVNVMAVEGAVV